MEIDFEARLVRNGYCLVTREEFENTHVPAGLHGRAALLDGKFVVYDPLDDEDGWLLVGDDREALARETCEKLELN